jgi:hypothetical protein
MPARYVRPYSKGQKNDFRDAEAIAEAVQRPTMKFGSKPHGSGCTTMSSRLRANKLARIAWSVLAHGRSFEASKLAAAVKLVGRADGR